MTGPAPRTDEPTSPFDAIPRTRIRTRGAADFPFSMGEVFRHLQLARASPASALSQAEATRRLARDFADRVLRPVALETERRVTEDPASFDWSVLRKACDYGFLSMMIPRSFGGKESRVLAMSVMAEELAAACAGWASTIAVHSAGVSCGMLTLDPYILEHHIRPTADAERRGEPIVWSGAVTEPQAGTDIWDEDFLEKARIVTLAKKVSGGYVLNGRKCFISNGSIAHYAVVAAALDPRNVRESWTLFLVPTDRQGFSVGRVERKLGQKASPAAELLFDDLFLPTELRLGEEGGGARAVTLYLAGSRGPVGAIGTGCARRALECLVDWATAKRNAGGRLIDQQAVQLAVARMAQEIALARQAYVSAALAYDRFIDALMRHPATRLALHALPSGFIRSETGRRLLASSTTKSVARGILEKSFPEDGFALASALATLAKVKGSDTGVAVAGEAARMMGHDASDPRWPVDKCYRDAKLTQIYEGTNQANTITFFKDMVRTWRER